MKNSMKIKNNHGFTIMDVVIGMLILTIFTGILTTSFYKIYKHNVMIRLQAIAVDYAIKIAEDVDKIKYDEVTNDLNNNIKERYGITEGYSVSVDVKNYNKDNEQTTQDIIKIVTINIQYSFLDEDKSYSIKKLKIKEL